MATSVQGERIAALVVTYDPDIDQLEKALESVRNQVTLIVVVDNASANFPTIRLLASRFDVHLIRNSINVGLATGLNVGVQAVRSKGYFDWILFLDQDSIPAPSYVSALLDSIRENPVLSKQVWVIRGVEVRDSASVAPRKGRRLEFIHGAIMSGSLVRFEALEAIRFRDEFFVDLVDTDFYFQIAESGHKVLRFGGTEIRHTVGKIVDLMGRPTSYEVSSRVYFIARNGLYLVLEGRFDFKLPWVILSSVLPATYVEGIRPALGSLLRGLRDGFVFTVRNRSLPGNPADWLPR